MTLLGYWWEDPWLFLGLLIVPLLLWRTLSLRKPGRVPSPSNAWLARAPGTWIARLWWLPDALRMVAVAALVLAAARPQVEDRAVVTGDGVDIMLALDMSGSMNSVDLPEEDLEAALSRGDRPRNRFEIARDTLQDFIGSRAQDRIGLVVFGPQAWLKYPLTLDYARLMRTLDGLVLDSGYVDQRTGKCLNGCTVSGAGTAIGDALGRSFNRLKRSKAVSKLVILVTDGKQEAGTLDPLAIARHLRDLPPEERVRVYTFLVGSQEHSWLPRVDFRGRPMVDAAGLPVYARPSRPHPIDPELLRQIADMTDGKFYRSYDAETFEADVKDLERTVFSSKVHVTRSDSFMTLLMLGFGLFLLEWLLRFTRFRGIV
jgi:Ca-activated chloride channel family protein